MTGRFAGRLFAQPPALDLALVGGVVWTGVASAPRTDAIGIAGERIVAIGGDAVRAATTARTRVVDLGGAFAVPARPSGEPVEAAAVSVSS